MAARGGLFLESTARDAFDKTSDSHVKTFIRAEVVEQVNLSRKPDPSSEGLAAPGGGLGPDDLNDASSLHRSPLPAAFGPQARALIETFEMALQTR